MKSSLKRLYQCAYMSVLRLFQFIKALSPGSIISPILKLCTPYNYKHTFTQILLDGAVQGFSYKNCFN